jgi:hypothetical protein
MPRTVVLTLVADGLTCERFLEGLRTVGEVCENSALCCGDVSCVSVHI